MNEIGAGGGQKQVENDGETKMGENEYKKVTFNNYEQLRRGISLRKRFKARS